MYVIKLPLVIKDCPQFWQNFVKDLSAEELQNALDENNMVLIKKHPGLFSKGGWQVEFANKEAFVFFKLRWGYEKIT